MQADGVPSACICSVPQRTGRLSIFRAASPTPLHNLSSEQLNRACHFEFICSKWHALFVYTARREMLRFGAKKSFGTTGRVRYRQQRDGLRFIPPPRPQPTVRIKGLEPPRLSAPDPKSGAATNYAISAVRDKDSFFCRQWQIACAPLQAPQILPPGRDGRQGFPLRRSFPPPASSSLPCRQAQAGTRQAKRKQRSSRKGKTKYKTKGPEPTPHRRLSRFRRFDTTTIDGHPHREPVYSLQLKRPLFPI